MVPYPTGRTGGAILASGVVRVNDSGFYTNSAQVGPAISSTVPIQMKASTFVNNTLLCDDTSFLDWVHVSSTERVLRTLETRCVKYSRCTSFSGNRNCQ